MDVVWQLPGGPGRHRVSEGSQIDAVALSPDAKLIAVAVNGDYGGGSREAAVYVFGVADGRELLRKYFPRRAWTAVAFVGDQWFAYSSSEYHWGMGRPDCRVMRIRSTDR